jgi:hypothetical protein
MAPPGGCAAQPGQARRLGGHAVGRDQLLLLTDRVDEAERMHAEADHADDRHRQQGCHCTQRNAQPRVPARRPENEERQRKARCELHTHACRQRGSCRAGMGARPPGSRAQRQRGAQRRQQQGVVVRSTHRQHQQYRVQAQERGRPHRRLAETPSGTRNQRDCAEAGDDCDRLERPQAARQPEGCDRIAPKREHRTVR